MIVNLSFHDGRQKIIPMASGIEIKEYHIIVTQESGQTELELRSQVDRINIIGV